MQEGLMRFSIIVSAYKVSSYLEAAIESCFKQNIDDFEIIIVTEKSPDDTLEIAQGIARRHPGYVTVSPPLDCSGSVGRTRNWGLPHAHGDYVVFLDGDDLLEPGSLATVDKLLQQNGNPEIAVNELNIVEMNGSVRHAPSAYHSPGKVVTGEDACMELLKNRPFFPFVWRNAYKREWLLSLDFPQPERRDEDFYWTPRVLLQAKRVLETGCVCCNYLQHEGSIIHSPNLLSLESVIANLIADLEFVPELPKALRNAWAAVDFFHFARLFGSRYSHLDSKVVNENILKVLQDGRRTKFMGLLPFAGLRNFIFGCCVLLLPISWCKRLVHKIYFYIT